MHKYIKLFYCGLVFLAACGTKGVPENVIPEPVMASLLTDIHVADGSLYAIDQRPDSLYKYGTGRYEVLFKQYHTTAKDFKASLSYYTTRPDVMQRVYEQISVNIHHKLDSLNKNNALNSKYAVPSK